MIKTLKFADHLIPIVLSGEKDITWRINDEKNLSTGNKVEFLDNHGKKFGEAELISVKETTFGNMTSEDKIGHEEFTSEEEKYATYSKYYKSGITPSTKLKVIKFKLLK